MLFGLEGAELGILMLVAFIFCIMLGFPIAFTLMALGVGAGYLAMGDHILPLAVQRTYSVMTNDVLLSVPLFTFMGYVIDRANILDRMFKALQLAVGGVPASLAVVSMLVCCLWGIASGIVGAVVTLMGLLALPAMLRAKYDVKLATGTICAGGTLGILIPPSVMLILYAATAGVSPVKLYAAAFIPGFGLTAAYIVYIVAVGIIWPEKAPRLPKEERDVPMSTIAWELLVSFLPLTVLTVLVLWVIFAGVATATESAAIGAVGALVLALMYRALTFEKLKEAVYLTARTTAMVCWLFVGSAIFSAVFAYLGGQAYVEQFVVGLDLPPWGFLIMAQVIIFLLGWPLEWTEIIIIFLPIFLPLLDHFGIDPLFFGVLVALNLQTSFLSPPVAMAPFYLKGVAPPEVNINDIFKGVYPFIAIVIMFMVALYIWPEMALWLPKYWYG
ncbi:C4-dicarboxylate ABC transporter [Terrihabitans soli]|uniref:C4-dicarboxylate ABC transporter n=1 Tax=Terrihabitans soli TaxID=708113 RepID=A0A6S6QLN7_9HYPH|nr:TRAP transporter large permease subunit [Terrihabitans soli]BCJ92253.1 C4-dicarboxylate ABC transporter [Terrihabitans soli]